MKFKEFSLYFYLFSLIILVITLAFFPKLFSNLDLNLNDMLDTGHSKYLEKVLSNNPDVFINKLGFTNESTLKINRLNLSINFNLII